MAPQYPCASPSWHSQTSEKLLAQAKLDEVLTPLQHIRNLFAQAKLDEVLTPLQNIPATPDPNLLREYKELIGSLLFLQTGTVPEISWIVSVLARYMTSAGELHKAAAKKVLRYLQSRKSIPITWCALTSSQPGTVIGYADASFANIPDTRLSSIGYVFLVNGGAVSWRFTKSPLQVLNAAEAEIVSLSSAAQEGAVFLRKLCIEMGFPQHSPTIIYEDCEAIVALSKETRFRKRSKHIALRWYYIAERQDPQIGDLRVVPESLAVAPRCSLTSLRRLAPHLPSPPSAIILSHTAPRSWLMIPSDAHSVICENAWTHHSSPRVLTWGPRPQPSGI
jgi:hypothetical protein